MIAIDKDFYIGVCALLNAKADIFDEDNILPQKFHNIFSDFIYGIFFFCFVHWTPLHYAAKIGDSKIVSMLLNFKADPNHADVFLYFFMNFV